MLTTLFEHSAYFTTHCEEPQSALYYIVAQAGNIKQ
jgi:hypothetical protein